MDVKKPLSFLATLMIFAAAAHAADAPGPDPQNFTGGSVGAETGDRLLIRIENRGAYSKSVGAVYVVTGQFAVDLDSPDQRLPAFDVHAVAVSGATDVMGLSVISADLSREVKIGTDLDLRISLVGIGATTTTSGVRMTGVNPPKPPVMTPYSKFMLDLVAYRYAHFTDGGRFSGGEPAALVYERGFDFRLGDDAQLRVLVGARDDLSLGDDSSSGSGKLALMNEAELYGRLELEVGGASKHLMSNGHADIYDTSEGGFGLGLEIGREMLSTTDTDTGGAMNYARAVFSF